MRCRYCNQPFNPRDDWHEKHGLSSHCSHGCLYATELPNSHAGQSFVSFDAMGSSAPDFVLIQDVAAAGPGNTQEFDEMERRFIAVIKLLAGMCDQDRDLVLFCIHNRERTLADYARKHRVSTQAVHSRLVKICRRHPCIKWAIKERRYRKRA